MRLRPNRGSKARGRLHVGRRPEPTGRAAGLPSACRDAGRRMRSRRGSGRSPGRPESGMVPARLPCHAPKRVPPAPWQAERAEVHLALLPRRRLEPLDRIARTHTAHAIPHTAVAAGVTGGPHLVEQPLCVQGSTIPAIVRSLRSGKIALCGNTSRKVHGNPGHRRALGATIRAKTREPEYPWWRVVGTTEIPGA